jgi:hypothetical protein
MAEQHEAPAMEICTEARRRKAELCAAPAPHTGRLCIREPRHWLKVPAGDEEHMHWDGMRRWPCPCHSGKG